MKFTVAALLATLITACFAQSIDIGSPANGTAVTPGSSIVVEVDQPDSLTSVVNVAVAIGIASCNNGPCATPGAALGTVLFHGLFNPQFQSSTPGKPPYQNFTVTIPPGLASGPAELSALAVVLVGDGAEPLIDTKAVVLNVI